MTGEERLRHHAETAYPYKIIPAGKWVRCIVGLGHSNSIAIEGDTSVILVDCLDSDKRGARLKELLREQIGKPVRTIIYTHGHPDHRGGSGAFRDTAEEIIMSSPRKPVLRYYDRLNDVLAARTARQFGYGLTDEECITQGIGIREGHAVNDGNYDFLPPTTLFVSDEEERVIDGVRIKLVSAVGETDDQLFVFLPDENILCCGDNYYGCWPNLYAIRGSQYRDVAAWIGSLEKIMSYEPEVLLPGHTLPIFGKEQILSVLGNFRSAIQSVLFQTLDCMNRGLDMNEAAEQVALPEEYRDLPYLQEFYGTVSWTVKGIYAGYLGWFDGNPVHLDPAPRRRRSREIMDLIGSTEAVEERIKTLYASGEYQLGLELCELLESSGTPVSSLKKQGLISMGKTVTSANARHYYLACAKELEDCGSSVV